MVRETVGVAIAKNQCAGPFGIAYDFYIERPALMRAVGRAIWGIDASALYRSIEATLSRLGDGATVIDVPCGGGVAFRGLRSDQDVRYIAGDISERMLERARARARSLPQVELVHADMHALPFADEQADVFLCYSGLHMIDDGARAVREIARCVKPGGALVGTAFVREGSVRQRALFALGARGGHALPPRANELRSWLSSAGFVGVELSPSRGFAAFSARKRSG